MLNKTFITIPASDFYGANIIAQGRDDWQQEVFCCIARHPQEVV